MTLAKRSVAVLASIALAVSVVLAVACVQPSSSYAKTVTGSATYNMPGKYAGGSYAKVTKASGKKITFKGSFYKTSGSFTSLKGTYTFKVNGKTRYSNLVNSETGATKSISKSSAFKKLKSGKYIAVNITVRGGVVKDLSFGV